MLRDEIWVEEKIDMAEWKGGKYYPGGFMISFLLWWMGYFEYRRVPDILAFAIAL